MDVGDIRFYKKHWKAVEEIERQELRAMSLEEHWRKLNAIVRFALEMRRSVREILKEWMK